MPKWSEWEKAANDASAALATLKEIQDEYQDRYDNMSDKQQEGDLGVRIAEIIELDIDSAISVVDECISAEKP